MRYISLRALLTALTALGFLAGPILGISSAGPINIEFTGADLSFDGTNITTAGASADELDSVTVTTKSGSITLTDDIFLDLFVPDVPPIVLPTAPDVTTTVTTPAGGRVEVDLPGGDFVSFELDPVTVTFANIADTFQFVFLASVATPRTVEQVFDELRADLPIALFDDPITFSLTATVDADSLPALPLVAPLASSDAPVAALVQVDPNGVVTGFTATGTGGVNGPTIPEPATLATLACSAGCLLGLRRRGC